MHTFSKDQSKVSRCKQKMFLLRIMQERTRHETKPTSLGYFFHECLQPDIPHTPITMHALRKQIYFCLNDTSPYAISTKGNDYLNCLYFLLTHYLELCLYIYF